MKKKTKSFGGAVAAGSALAGAALGAAAVILSDKKNQAKIKKTIDDVSHEAVVMGKKLKKKAEELKNAAQKNEASRSNDRGIFSPLLRRERNPSEAQNSSHSSSGSRPRFSAKGDKKKTVSHAPRRPSGQAGKKKAVVKK